MLMDLCQASVSPLDSRLKGGGCSVFYAKSSVFIESMQAASNMKTMYFFSFAVLPAGTAVVARSTTVAPADTVPSSHDCHLHRSDPNL